MMQAIFENTFLEGVESCKRAVSTTTVFSRDLGWEDCYASFYNAFQKPSPSFTQLAQTLALYLATFGMYRNSFLLLCNYRVHVDAIKIIFERNEGAYRYKPLLGYDWNPKSSTYSVNRALLFDKETGLYKRLSEKYESIAASISKTFLTSKRGKRDKRDERVMHATQTLITKILLGTLGCVPAYDENFKHGIGEANGWRSDISKNFSCKSIESLRKLWDDMCSGGSSLSTPSFSSQISSLIGGWSLRSHAHIDYPLMRVIDMGVWFCGIDREK